MLTCQNSKLNCELNLNYFKKSPKCMLYIHHYQCIRICFTNLRKKKATFISSIHSLAKLLYHYISKMCKLHAYYTQHCQCIIIMLCKLGENSIKVLSLISNSTDVGLCSIKNSVGLFLLT